MKLHKNKTTGVSFHPLTGILCLIMALLFACTDNEKELFSEFRSFPHAEWSQSDSLRFYVSIQDTVSYYDVFLELRNNNHYPFRNIWLFINYQTPLGEIRSDTLNAELADIYGKWYGKGINLYSYSFPYSFDIQYQDTGTYIYTIRQGMRQDPLSGISDIGLRILKKGNQ